MIYSVTIKKNSYVLIKGKFGSVLWTQNTTQINVFSESHSFGTIATWYWALPLKSTK